MKFIYSILIGVSFALVALSAQAQEKCITEIMFQEAAKANPQLLVDRNAYEKEIAEYIKNNPQQRAQGSPRIIPVVFHIIHTYGSENISRAQCIDQLRVLNEDFNRMNADTVNTPAPFKLVAGDTNIEFRLATKDPSGNCTDGIVRVYSPLTHEARNNVKALSYWPSNKYLNFWTVQFITTSSGVVVPGQFVAGFAQFPGMGPATTDGIVCRSDQTGTIGTSIGNLGRTATHEIGHWLSLRHIWGDATCGNDLVADTPTQQGPNQSNCPNFPSITCGNGPNGDMFPNYMDYTDDQCMNLFSAGQAVRMNATLSSSTSGRNNLWTQANLIATGTDDNANPQDCAPIADFDFKVKRVCANTNVVFSDASWSGPVTSRTWSFPGGTPSTSTAANPQVSYSAPGQYDATLTVSNSTGTDTKTRQNVVSVSPNSGWLPAPFNEDFEATLLPGWYWFVENSAATTNAWEVISGASVSGTKSAKLTNYTNNTGVDAFITPSINLSNVSGTQMTFQLAHAARTTSGDNTLKIYVSTNCGQTWSLRYTKAGASLTTAGIVTSNFTPTPAEWRMETVNLSSSSISGQANVMFKFEYTQENGNNIYIDDINIDGLVGLEELINQYQINLYPNPAQDKTQLTFHLSENAVVSVALEDVLGKRTNVATESRLNAGTHNYVFETNTLAKGIYLVKLNINDQLMTKKLIIE